MDIPKIYQTSWGPAAPISSLCRPSWVFLMLQLYLKYAIRSTDAWTLVYFDSVRKTQLEFKSNSMGTFPLFSVHYSCTDSLRIKSVFVEYLSCLLFWTFPLTWIRVKITKFVTILTPFSRRGRLLDYQNHPYMSTTYKHQREQTPRSTLAPPLTNSHLLWY